jgi:hypothetical protein
MFKIRSYLRKNNFISIVFSYLLFSALLKSTTEIDLCIPCIWQSIFGVHCPGCGLTTAFISMIEFDFKNAFESNWSIFIIVPIVIYYVIQDYVKFKNEYNP